MVQYADWAGIYEVCVDAEFFRHSRANDSLNVVGSEQDICLGSEGISIARFGS
jgi:hypothetical protein